MCGEKDIFDDDPLTDSQLMAVVNAPTPVDPVVPVRSAETEEALEPAPNFDWVWSSRIGIPPTLSIAWRCRKRGKGTQVSLLHLLDLSPRKVPGRRLSSGLTNLSLVTNFRRFFWKLSVLLASRQPWIASLVVAPNLRE